MNKPFFNPIMQALVITAVVWAGACFAQATPEQLADAQQATDAVPVTDLEQVSAVVPGSELESMTGPLLRMVLSLALVLALVGVFAWLAKRFRGGQMQGGLIQIVSGLSLGPKDRVVLLRVGQEEVLVGLSPGGMRVLHVMNKSTSASGFSLGMADRDNAVSSLSAAESSERG